MKRCLIILTCVLTVAFISCEKKNVEDVQKSDRERLEKLHDEIKDISESVICEDADEWAFSEIGSKACGGPIGYIAYSTTIDTDDFLAKVKRYTELQNQYNKDWGIISDCSLPARPTDVVCNDGKPTFVYDNIPMVPNE